MSELVTGEAVVLGLRPARLPSRGLAVAVDVAVAWVTYIGISLILVSATSSMDSAAVAAVSVAAFVLVQVGIPIVIETLSQGRSLGKLVCGLRVVREDGGPIRFRHALVRGAMGAIEIVMTMGVVAAIASLVSARGRRLGDVFAGTLVIRERMPVAEAGAALPPPPPWLVAELGALDLSRVPDGWWLTVRQYLARMGQLDPQVGGAMAGRLAEDLRGFTGVPAPAGVHPAAYLAAVAGERQARESQRAFGASAPSSAGAGLIGAVGAAPVGWGEGAPGGQPGAGGGGAGAGGSWTSHRPVETAGDVVTSGGGHHDAPSAGGAWASPGGGAGAPEAGAGAGRTRGDGAGAVGVQGRAGDAGDGGGGRPPRTGFAPPV
ncbi:RDD family protein [Streptomyces sp. P9-2B-2]|uniref:RDD family protein n=1 Tax=Streptomyces TaxID=1883 RepID=UPI00224E536D|nr:MULTISPECIES: RDD family protein [Streptomyces]MCX4640557.1 RDD family protein [Streptomyces platensis]WJY38604.1 RDD family protein [Streptomyces sp. P9-2B-2]